MSYLVLARKYRPDGFEAVSGQEHVTRTLSNAIRRGKVAHAYLFSGPRGVGKTSIARIFAKALNCSDGPTASPCKSCTNCREIAEGTSIAVREIDGASHNSVDNVRELIESFRCLPAPGSRYKIYIIDEVHMLSTSAFNALLKSLEEPPPHTVFIMATTELHKIPQTVVSRCQRFDFRALSHEEIQACLAGVAAKEDIHVEPEVFRMVSRLAEGSMRDAQSLLDRVISFCDGGVTAAEAGQVLGVVEKNVLLQASRCIFTHDAAGALGVIGTAFSTGLEPSLFLKEFSSHWRELMLAKIGGTKPLQQLGVDDEGARELIAQVKDISIQDVQDLAQMAREGADKALRSFQPKYALEALVVRMATRESVEDIGRMLDKLRSLLSGSKASMGEVKKGEQRRAGAERKAQPVFSPEPAPKSGAAPTASEPSDSAREGAISWSDFVARASKAGSPMLCEQLRRLSVAVFVPGQLSAKGPEFTVNYLSRPENRAKLQEILNAYSGVAVWEFKFEFGENGSQAEPGSLKDVETKESNARRKKQTDTLKSHPKVQTIKKAFPGSVIEHVKVKEE